MTNDAVIRLANELALDLIKSVGGDDADSARGSTGDVARSLSLMNVAMFDAVNGVQGAYAPIRIDLPAAAFTNDAAAAASAAATVLTDLFQTTERREQIAEFLDTIISNLNGGGVSIANGQSYGAAVAGRLLSERRYDMPGPDEEFEDRAGGFNRSWGAHFRGMQPWVMKSRDQFRPPPPPSSHSTKYAKAWEEVYDLGHRTSASRTEDQTTIARVWSGGANTSRPSGMWFEAAIYLSEDQQLDLMASARLFALLGLAICDSMISSWDAKYTYNFWRPNQAIRQAHIDGNDNTRRDLNWWQLNGGIGGSPEYTSGTSTFAGAAAYLLKEYFGGDLPFELDLQASNDDLAAPPRTYQTFKEARDEAAMSRIYNGIHFRFSNEAGIKAGEQIAELILQEHPA